MIKNPKPDAANAAAEKKILGKSILWNTVGSIYYAMCQWFMTVVIIHMSRDYTSVGILGLAMTVTNSFSSIASFGMRSYQVSDIRKIYSNENYIMSRYLTCFAAYLACIVYTAFIAKSTAELVCILIYMVIRVIDSTEDVYQGVLQVNWRFDVIGKSFIARGTLQLAAFIGVFILTHRLEFTLAAMAVLNGAVLLFYDRRKTRDIAGLGRIRFERKVIDLLKNCSKLVVYYFMAASLATVVRVSIKEICGVDELGVYSTIAAPTVIIQLTANVVYSPFLPGISKAFFDGNRKKFIGYIRNIFLIIAGGFAAVNVGGYFLGHRALELLYNADVASHDKLLLPLIWCTFFSACVWFFAGMLIAIRKPNQLMAGVVFAFILNYVISKPLIRHFGENGGSYSQVISEVSLMLIYVVMLIVNIRKYRPESGGRADAKKIQEV